MEKVTYILGAGFSAPLGLPVMSNFLFKSKDLYYENQDSYAHFKKVFDSIENLSILKNYYNSNLFNIEEILSLTEMMDFLDGKKLSEAFTRYISDVISYYTPPMQPYRGGVLPGNWYDFLFGHSGHLIKYGYFVGNLLRMTFNEVKNARALPGSDQRKFHATVSRDEPFRYSVLTMNYDLVLENVVSFIESQFVTEGNDLSFEKATYDPDWQSCHLAKLHGCLKGGVIVPPTWAKGTHPEVVPAWKTAYQVLRDTNHIRFIGYSLPESDSYIKYLLKSAVVGCKHLKTIDVICLDPDDSVKARFDELLAFGYYRFKDASVTDYLDSLMSTNQDIRRDNYTNRNSIKLNFLEKAHSNFWA